MFVYICKVKHIEMIKIIFLLFLSCGITIGIHAQQAGDLDITFGTNGKVITDVDTGSDYGYAVAVKSDGKIIAAGSSDGKVALVRYTSSGSVDFTFGYLGKVITEIGTSASILSMKLQPDGKIVGAGFTYVTQYQIAFFVVRYTSNGSLDNSFGNGGFVTTVFGNANDYGRALALQPDGKILVTGECGGMQCDFSTVRYNNDGSLDNSFGNGGIVITNMGNGLNLPKAIAVQNDNKIIVVGYAEPGAGMVRYNPDGTIDSQFGTGGKIFTNLGMETYQTAVVIQPDNKILVAGDYQTYIVLSNVIFRYNPDGSPDNSFGTGGMIQAPSGYSDNPKAMILQQNGDIVIAGYSAIGGWSYFELMKFYGNGSVDSTFGYNGRVQTEFYHYDRCNGLAIQPDGNLVAAGYTSVTWDDVRFALARYIGDGPVVIPEVRDDLFAIYPNPSKDKVILQLPAISGKTSLEIWNVYGKRLSEWKILNPLTEINIKDLESGIYLFKLQSGKTSSTKKIIKQ